MSESPRIFRHRESGQWVAYGEMDMREVVISFTDLDAEQIDVDGGSWLAVGLDAGRLEYRVPLRTHSG